MPHSKKVSNLPTYIYVVQDYEQHICGVYSSLLLASKVYERVVSEGLSPEDIATLREEYGEDYHDELEYPPCIVVYELDSNHVWSYDSLREVKQALEQGENYD